MKKILYSAISAMLLFLGSACERDDYEFKQTASITVVNAASANGAVKVNPGAGSGFSYSRALEVTNGASGVFGAFAGSNIITVVKSLDTTTKLFERTIDLQPISTLYIAGTSAAVDTIFRVERNFPLINSSDVNAESAMWVRFVNLSPNSGSVNLRISGTTTNEVTALAYKGISDFKKYNAPPAPPGTTQFLRFEIRNDANTVTLATFDVNYNNTRYKTASVIYRGLVKPGPTPGSIVSDPLFPIGTFQVNYN
jgi:hypothetical protein